MQTRQDPVPSVKRAPRLTVAAALVACLVVAAPVLAPAALAAKKRSSSPSNRAYKGKTTQGLAVSLGKQGRGGRAFKYQAAMSCNDGTTFTDNAFTDLVTLRRGKFHVRYKSDKGATVTDVKGKVRGKRASGTVKITEHYGTTPNASGNYPLDPHGTVICQSGAVKWTARAR